MGAQRFVRLVGVAEDTRFELVRAFTPNPLSKSAKGRSDASQAELLGSVGALAEVTGRGQTAVTETRTETGRVAADALGCVVGE